MGLGEQEGRTELPLIDVGETKVESILEVFLDTLESDTSVRLLNGDIE